MILTETIVHSHHHGATGFEIFLWVLAAIATMWLLDSGWERATKWWHAWREEHGSTQVEDAVDDRPDCEINASCEPYNHSLSWPCVYAPVTGERWTPPDAPTRDEAARAAERSET